MTSLSLTSPYSNANQPSYFQIGEMQIKTIENYTPLRILSYLSPSTSDEHLGERPILSLSTSFDDPEETTTLHCARSTLPAPNRSQSSENIDTSRWGPEGKKLIAAVREKNLDLAQQTLQLDRLHHNSIFTSAKEEALSIAAEDGNCAIVNALLENDVLEQHWYYRMHLYYIGTAMIQAARQGHLRVVKQLVDYILQKPHNETYYQLFNLIVHKALEEKPQQEIADILTSWEGYRPFSIELPSQPVVPAATVLPQPTPTEAKGFLQWVLGY